MLDGEMLEVKRVDGDRVMYCEYGEDVEEEDIDVEDEGWDDNDDEEVDKDE